MNVTVTIQTTDSNKQEQTKEFFYEYEPTKERFIAKMAKEVMEQMGHNVPASEMEEMLKASHPQAVFDFAVCSDWLLENIPLIAKEIKQSSDETYKVTSFEIFNNGVSEAKYDKNHMDLRDMMVHMNRDFNEMIKEA